MTYHPMDAGVAALVMAYLLSIPFAADHREALVGTTIQYKNAGALFLALCSIIGLYLNTLEETKTSKTILGIGQFLLLVGLIGNVQGGVAPVSPCFNRATGKMGYSQ